MPPSKLLVWLSDKQIKIESILVTLVVIAFITKTFHVPGGDQFLLILMMTLASFYFLSAYIPAAESKNFLVIVARKVIDIGSSVCALGIAFSVFHLMGANRMLTIGTGSLVAAVLILIFPWMNGGSKIPFPLLTRILTLGILSLVIIMNAK